MKAKRRLLIISFSYARPVKREKLVHLQKHFDVYLIHPRSYPEVYEEDHGHPIPVTLVRHWFLFSRTPNPPRIVMALPLRFMKQFRPDFIHVESEMWCPTLLWVILLHRWGVLRSKITVHCAANQIIQGWKGRVRSAVYRWVGKRIAAIIGCSSGVTQVNRTLIRRPNLIYATFPHLGPSPERFYPDKNTSKRDPFVYGYLGRLSEEKGVTYLLSAFANLSGDARQSGVLDIYGTGPETDHLKNQSGGNPAIRFQGYVDPEAVPVCMRKIDVFILPSIITSKDCEQWGLALVEAMLSGLPVISTNVGAIPEVLHGYGKIVSQRDPAALTEAMQHMFSDFGRQKAKALEARDFAVKNYSGEALAGRFTEVLNSLVRN